MEFLKDVLGERYGEFCGIIDNYNKENPENAVFLANLSDGEYTKKSEYSATIQKYEKDIKRLSDELNKKEFDYKLELLIRDEKPKNTKALKALIDLDKIVYENGVISGFKEQIEKLKKEESYLFASGDMPQFTRPVSSADDGLTREEYQKLSYMEKLKLKKEAPKIFSKLK